MTNQPKKQTSDNAMERMNEALKAAMKMPPRKHKDEPKRKSKATSK